MTQKNHYYPAILQLSQEISTNGVYLNRQNTHTSPSDRGRGSGGPGAKWKEKEKIGEIFDQKLTTKSNIKEHDRINHIRFLTSTTPLSCSRSHDFFPFIFLGLPPRVQEGLLIAQIKGEDIWFDLIEYDTL